MVSLPRRPGGTLGQALPVAVGLGIQAVTAYATLIVAGRVLGAAEFGGLAALYAVLTSLATGLFQPLEQEVSRRRGRERETRRYDPTLLWRAIAFGLCLCALTGVVVLAAHGPGLRLLGNEPQLLAAFCVAVPGYALCFVSRGALSGSRRLGRYGLQLSTEGLFRLVVLGCLVLAGVRSAAAFGWLFGLAPWVALAVSLAGLRRPSAPADARTVPSGRHQPLVAPLLLLLVSTLSAQLLIGAGPVSAKLFAGPGDQNRAGAFLAALVVVRLPILLFTAVQPSMLPAMSAHVAAGRSAAFRSLLSKVLAAMGALALLTTVGTAVLGPWGLRLLFGPGFDLSWSVFLLMGLSVGLFMAATVLGQSLLALGEHRFVTLGWVLGIVGLVAGTALVRDAILRATLGLLVGAGVAAVTFGLLLWHSLRHWAPAPGAIDEEIAAAAVEAEAAVEAA
jgi:O-antigen/teichoic acid export membrane protein